jgi:hypothetical protein
MAARPHAGEGVSAVTNKIQFRRSGDWTMVYLNGELVMHGDHYHADEWLQERCGVEVVDDEAGHCIPDGFHPIKLLSEVEEKERAAAELKAKADEKRAEAQRLLDEAEAMEAGR